jgi:hypothetical protein
LKEAKMKRSEVLLKAVAAAGAAGLLLTGCSGDNDIPTPGDGDGAGNGGDGSSDSGEASALSIMEDWEGCEALDDLQPLQEFLGAESVNSGDGMTTSRMGVGLDAEAAGCQGQADLATYVFEGEVTSTETTGLAVIQAGVVPWDSEDEASENFQQRLEQLEDAKHQGTEYTDEQEGELGGDWSESYYLAADIEYDYTVNAYGRMDDWIVYLTMNVSDDPGVAEGDDPVYPFTNEELVDWVVNDYMTQLQSGILEKMESGQ